ncbi:unnamed protein product [Rotaria magnacalcarata]|uniref:NAD(P)(+)--arginine ADP-ribosyltransferase n=3 Tax=Rotaria magnacalcarata TaxID=392030 RepID=A0A815FPS0_9BILA|nr:unnamed protein product [Rotaria magnacalcarata]CAF1587699.1 unnamed protein product [Rotaria magnacalcarata]CAF4290711.1 unnamed protein product [Rotaria magnacalcarata]CAF4436111.1 unnamed protein product [Rotaria magnacalcarata]
MEDINDLIDTQHRFYDADREPGIMMAPVEGYSDKPLVTLEEAVAQIIVSIPAILTKVEQCKKYAADYPANNLSIDELAAIKLYTLEWSPYQDSLYYILNTKLRTEDREALKPWFLYLKLILTGLARLPTNQHRVYRGVTLANDDQYRQGNTIVWWGFSSCSTKRNISEHEIFLNETGKKTLFIIDCITGRDISQYSIFQKEKEILLLPATTLQVIRTYRDKQNFYNIIHLQEIKSTYTLLEPILLETKILNPVKNRMLNILRVFWKQTQIDTRTKLDQEIDLFRDREHACIRRKRFTDDEIETVVNEVIMKKQCQALFLRGNEITPQGAIMIGKSLENNITLSQLFLTDIQIGDVGAEVLARSLSNGANSSLKELSLNNNGITDDGAEQLANMLKQNSSLIKVWIIKNCINDRGIQALARDVANNNTLQLLSLMWNQVKTSETVNVIIHMLEINQTLVRFEINGQSLSSRDLKRLKDFVRTSGYIGLTIH